MNRDVVANNQNGKNPAQRLKAMKQWGGGGFSARHVRHYHLAIGGGKRIVTTGAGLRQTSHKVCMPHLDSLSVLYRDQLLVGCHHAECESDHVEQSEEDEEGYIAIAQAHPAGPAAAYLQGTCGAHPDQRGEQ